MGIMDRFFVQLLARYYKKQNIMLVKLELN